MNEQIPQYVIEALAAVRESGETNMFDRRVVIELAANYNDDASEWLASNLPRYMEALNAMGEYIRQPASPPVYAVVSDEELATEYAAVKDEMDAAGLLTVADTDYYTQPEDLPGRLIGVYRELEDGNIIRAVKEYRQIYDVSLVEAKDAVDDIRGVKRTSAAWKPDIVVSAAGLFNAVEDGKISPASVNWYNVAADLEAQLNEARAILSLLDDRWVETLSLFRDEYRQAMQNGDDDATRALEFPLTWGDLRRASELYRKSGE